MIRAGRGRGRARRRSRGRGRGGPNGRGARGRGRGRGRAYGRAGRGQCGPARRRGRRSGRGHTRGGRAGAVAPPEKKVWVKVLRCKGCDQALRKHSKEKTFVYEPADVACNHCSLYCGKCVGGHVEEAMKSRSKSIGCVEAECKCTFNDADFEALVEANVLPEKTYVDWLRNRVKGECCICLEDDPRNMVELACGHSFHINCLKLQLDAKWGGMRVTHQYMNCALCRSEIKAADSRTPQGKQLKKMILPHLQLRARVFRLCKKIALEDNHVKEEAKEEEIRKFVEEKMAVFTCNRCKEPYCGGLQDCGVEMKMKPEDLVCSDCSWKENHSQFKCREHGAQFAVYKCDCCCSLATFDCGGNHFCEWCHAHLDSKLGERPKCQGRECDKCPLGKPHPPNNPRTCGGYKGYVIGCVKCLGIDGWQPYISKTTENDFNIGAGA